MFCQVVSGFLLGLSPDLANHDNSLGGGIIDEQLQAVDEVCSIEGISPDADTQGLAEADSGGLVDSLVCKSARPRDHSDAALLVDVAGHDADLDSLVTACMTA